MKRSRILLGITMAVVLTLSACQRAGEDAPAPEDKALRLHIVATTTMLADLAREIGGDGVRVTGLMGPGIDPHQYQASAGDVQTMNSADVVIYNGIGLEGKLSHVFDSLKRNGATVVSLEEGLDKAKLLEAEGEPGIHDPHIWFDVSLWQDAAFVVARGLAKADPENSAAYVGNAEKYQGKLGELDAYIKDRVREVPAEQRILITAHDAFGYFGKAYGFEVKGLQGISTEAEAGTSDVRALAGFIAVNKIKAIFVESSVPPRTIEALQAAVRAQGFDVAIGGELYSDSLGDEKAGTATYLLTVKGNIDTIVNALK